MKRKPLTKNQVLARVSNWESYCMARSFDDAARARARWDLAYLKRNKNWKNFESGMYAIGTRTHWTFMYPAEISTPLPWELLRRMAATLITA